MKIGSGSSCTKKGINMDFWQKIVPPDGIYEGKQSGYNVHLQIDGKEVRFEAKNGVRGLNIPVIVAINDGTATVQYKR